MGLMDGEMVVDQNRFTVNKKMVVDPSQFARLDPNYKGDPPRWKGKLHKSSAAEVKVKIEKKWTTLCEAAANNAADFKKILEEVSAETQLVQTTILNFARPSEDALIHIAAKHGNADIVKLIIEKVPCLFRKKGFNGDTVWHIAAKTGNVFDELYSLWNDYKNYLESSRHGQNCVKVTWDDISLRDVNEDAGNTVLHEALIKGDNSFANKLVEADWDLSLYVNKDKKTALYLAAEAGYEDIVKFMLDKATTDKTGKKEGEVIVKGKSILHAAIMGRHKAVLVLILDCKAKLIERRKEEGRELHHCLTETKDEEGMNPLHWAASIGFVEGVSYLIDKKIPMDKDKKQFYPIHWASKNGHVEVVKALLPHHDNLNDLVTCDGHNVLHLAAKHGRHNVVSHILDADKTLELVYLLNKGDAQQNTPLHLATVHWHPKIVSALTWDNRVDLKLTNEDGLTALDAALLNIKGIGSIRQWLTWQVLLAARVPRVKSDKDLNAKRTASMKSKPTNTVNYFVIVRALFLASIAVGFVSYETRSSNFTYDNNFNTYMGTTTSVAHIKRYIFAFCNYVSTFTSIGIMFALIWANFGDANRVFNTLRYAKPLLRMAVTMSSLALMLGMAVGSKHNSLVDVLQTLILVSLVFFAMLFFPICLPFPAGYRIIRYMTYFPICLMIFLACDLVEE